MVVVGDKVRISSRKIGQGPRDGIVTGASGPMLRIRWSTGEESSFIPGPGSVMVVSRRRAPSQKTPR
jgi:hypothetical protein